ncbi:hypothetical protein EJ04DRAFT_571298 [Polyplosphaeria fusca]|uniref:Uncharacterized protein n=1 Tax=Polyplosphaeria fusca TaxID=682080 RepID=A0A9P4UV56_9PLEO|nr:hypothetical protein EJ04DRAFT_571298 [Polyplosphaeria fusca]
MEWELRPLAPLAPSSLQLGRAATTLPLDNRATSSDVDDETSRDEFDDGADEKEEYSSNVAEEPSSSRGNRRWSKEGDERLRRWKGECKSWGWICSRFSNRSLGAVQQVSHQLDAKLISASEDPAPGHPFGAIFHESGA